jgi:hypothetical protein
VEDNTTWAVDSQNFDGVDEESHPSVINVSISMKILEQVREGKGELAYYFTDNYTLSDALIASSNAAGRATLANVQAQAKASLNAALSKQLTPGVNGTLKTVPKPSTAKLPALKTKIP